MSQLNRLLQHRFEMRLAHTDAAPAYPVEISAVDPSADGRNAPCPVFVDVIKRRARIEAGAPAELDAAAELADAFHQPTCWGKTESARRTQAIEFSLGVAGFVGVQ